MCSRRVQQRATACTKAWHGWLQTSRHDMPLRTHRPCGFAPPVNLSDMFLHWHMHTQSDDVGWYFNVCMYMYGFLIMICGSCLVCNLLNLPHRFLPLACWWLCRSTRIVTLVGCTAYDCFTLMYSYFYFDSRSLNVSSFVL